MAYKWEAGDWTCSCGENNFKKRDSCRKCGKNRGRPGDWKCNTCGELNFANRISCRKCNPTPKPGDWICPNDLCKELNFGSRVNCRKCNTSKDTIVQQPIMQQNTNDNKCVICLDKDKTHLITKCGHFCYCEVCGFAIDKCPMCRVIYDPSKDLLRVYS